MAGNGSGFKYREQVLSKLILDVHVSHGFSDMGAHSKSFGFADQAAPWLALVFDFTFTTFPEPGLNFCTETDVLFFTLSIDC